MLFAVATTSLLVPRAPAPRMEVATPSPPAISTPRGKELLVPVFPETCEYTGITLTRYMNEVARANPELLDLETLISSIQTACKTIKVYTCIWPCCPRRALPTATPRPRTR